ncbi:PEP-CTERM sorting domain-containing protein [Synechococcus sp. PCC 7336]|uniref:PEP-CTERM sorting domain-containing protein n=1 Tax=Synechococcus sp. PCC 7336 TaxID=195250 RepID=UPI00034DB280|nr:PEP-CTERM sorting domain-containing protein [Synechococcus sp. PCC 7336]
MIRERITDRSFLFAAKTVILSLGLLAGSATASLAGVGLEVGQYRLKDHPFGGAAPPTYGLRLDGLLTDDASDVFTFSFDPGVFLTYDGSSITIEGTVRGGLDLGNSAPDPSNQRPDEALFDLLITYSTGIVDVAQGIKVDPGPPTHTGSLTLVEDFDFDGDGNDDFFANDIFLLREFLKSDGTSFIFAADGHRLGSTPQDVFVGRGWLTHENNGVGTSHNQPRRASDFLFVGTQIPEPTTVLGSLAALGGSYILKRKRSQANDGDRPSTH